MKLNWTTKFISIAVLAMGVAAMSNAQGAGPTGSGLKPSANAKQHRAQPIQIALKDLTLTKDQKVKIKELMKTRNSNVKTFRDQHVADRKAVGEYVKQQQQTLLDGIKGVLSPADWDKFETAYKEAVAANRKGRKKNASTSSTTTSASSTSSSSTGTGTSSGNTSTSH